MANRTANPNPLFATWRNEFEFNLRSQTEICDGKQAHADITYIDSKRIRIDRCTGYANRRVQ
jgi:hypothetical protein